MAKKNWKLIEVQTVVDDWKEKVFISLQEAQDYLSNQFGYEIKPEPPANFDWERSDLYATGACGEWSIMFWGDMV